MENQKVILSVADSKVLPLGKGSPIYFRIKEYKYISDMLDDITKNGVAYSPAFFIPKLGENNDYGFKTEKEFVSTGEFLILDVDSGVSSNDVLIKAKEKDYNVIIIPSKNNNKEKDGIVAERFHIFIGAARPFNIIEYKTACKKISKELCNEKDDPTSHSPIRYFAPSPSIEYTETKWYHGKNLIDITEDEIIKPLKSKSKNKIYSDNINHNDIINYFNKYLKSISLKHYISHYNDSNETFNLHRDENDKNPGCFIGLNDNIIFDGATRRPDKQYTKTYYSPNQIFQSQENKNKDTNNMAEKIKQNILNKIDPSKDYTAIITSEGVGKSSLIFEYIKKMNKNRAILLCKSYAQVYDKKKLFDKYNPDKKVEIILGNEKFLDKYLVLKNEWVYNYDEKTGEKFVSLERSIDNASINLNQKTLALNEMEKYKRIIEKEEYVDIILMAEDKLRIEVSKKGRLTSELIIYDEFNADQWYLYLNATELEQKLAICKDDLVEQETWNEKVLVTLIKKEDWKQLTTGPKIVLSTELKCEAFMNYYFPQNKVNIIKETDIFLATNVTIRIVNPAFTQKNNGNKEYLAMACRENDYIVWGNGVKSTINHVSVNGRNMHDDITKDSKIVIIFNQPSPQELAPIMKGINLSKNEASILILSDAINQYLGRCNGYRQDLKYTSIDIILPETYADEVLQNLRYVCNIKTGYKNENYINPDILTNKQPTLTIIDKIVHTLACKYNVNRIKVIKKLYLSTLTKRVNSFIKKINEMGSDIVSIYKNMKFYKTVKKLNSIQEKELARLYQRVSTISFHDILYRIQYNNKNNRWMIRNIPLFE